MKGIGAMIHYLGGGSPKNPADFFGRTIKEAVIFDNELKIKFDDNTGMRLWDAGQSCCEARYMSCDDKLSDLFGKVLNRISVKPVDNPDRGDYDEEHEIVFVEIQAGDETISIANHNEHNGYYGGFGLSVDEL